MSDAAIATLVTGIVTVVTMVVGFLTLWVKLKYGVERTEEIANKANTVEQKIDNNTVLTMAATEAAASTAAVAAKTATVAKAATDEITKKLNGGVDSAIEASLKPVRDHLVSNTKKIEDLEKYVHHRNHELLNAIQVQTNKLDQILHKISIER